MDLCCILTLMSMLLQLQVHQEHAVTVSVRTAPTQRYSPKDQEHPRGDPGGRPGEFQPRAVSDFY